MLHFISSPYFNPPTMILSHRYNLWVTHFKKDAVNETSPTTHTHHTEGESRVIEVFFSCFVFSCLLASFKVTMTSKVTILILYGIMQYYK